MLGNPHLAVNNREHPHKRPPTHMRCPIKNHSHFEEHDKDLPALQIAQMCVNRGADKMAFL